MSGKTQADFQEWAKTYLKEIHSLLQGKGGQYSKTEIKALHNFTQASKIWESTEAYQILQYATKHWVFLVDKAKDGRWGNLTPKEMRQVEESARDMIIYMLLLIFGQLS